MVKRINTELQDLRYALSNARKQAGLRHHCGADSGAWALARNTAIFSVIDALVLRAGRLHKSRPTCFSEFAKSAKRVCRRSLDGGLLDWRQQAKTISGMSALRFAAFTYSENAGALRVNGMEVSPNLFEVMGETPLMGRFFADGDDRPGSDDILVVSESFWRGQLGSDPAQSGKLFCDSKPFTIVGVARGVFDFPSGTLMWKPLPLTNAEVSDRTNARGSRWPE